MTPTPRPESTHSPVQPESEGQTTPGAQGSLVEQLAEAIKSVVIPDSAEQLRDLTDVLAPLVNEAYAQGYRVARDHWKTHAAAEVEAAVSVVRAERDAALQGVWDMWVALGHDSDGDSGPGAWIAGSGAASFIVTAVKDAAAIRQQWEEDYDADTDRLEVEVRALREKVAKVEAALASPTLQSCGGLDIGDDGCFLGDLVRPLRAALSDPTTPDQKGGE